MYDQIDKIMDNLDVTSKKKMKELDILIKEKIIPALQLVGVKGNLKSEKKIQVCSNDEIDITLILTIDWKEKIKE